MSVGLCGWLVCVRLCLLDACVRAITRGCVFVETNFFSTKLYVIIFAKRNVCKSIAYLETNIAAYASFKYCIKCILEN